MSLFVTPKFCISIVFSFSWGQFNSQEKLKTMLTQNFGVTNKDQYGILWYFLEWSIGLSPAKLECLLKTMTFRFYVHFFLQATPPIDFFWFTRKFYKRRRYRVNYRVRCQYPNIFSQELWLIAEDEMLWRCEPRSQALSRTRLSLSSVGTGRREPWERGWLIYL